MSGVVVVGSDLRTIFLSKRPSSVSEVASGADRANRGKIINPEQQKKEHRCKCGKVFYRGKNLYAHVRNIHGEEPLKYACKDCKKKHKTVDALLRHTCKSKTSDHTYVITRQNRIVLVCPAVSCKQKFAGHYSLVKHLSQQHNLTIEVEGHIFQSVSDFHKWKTNMENTTLSSYVPCSESKKTHDGTWKTYYGCSSSFSFTLPETEDKIRLKDSVKDSCKNMNVACPSRLEVNTKVIDEAETVTVKFWKPHFGHSDLQNIKKEGENETYGEMTNVFHIVPTANETSTIANVVTKHNYVTKLLSGTLTLGHDEAEALDKQYDTIIHILNSIPSKTNLTNT